MQQAHYLDTLCLDAVDHNKGRAAYYQLACALPAAGAPDFRICK
jgi:hypothetical protein